MVTNRKYNAQVICLDSDARSKLPPMVQQAVGGIYRRALARGFSDEESLLRVQQFLDYFAGLEDAIDALRNRGDNLQSQYSGLETERQPVCASLAAAIDKDYTEQIKALKEKTKEKEEFIGEYLTRLGEFNATITQLKRGYLTRLGEFNATITQYEGILVDFAKNEPDWGLFNTPQLKGNVAPLRRLYSSISAKLKELARDSTPTVPPATPPPAAPLATTTPASASEAGTSPTSTAPKTHLVRKKRKVKRR